MDTYLIANGGCGERLTSVMLMLYQSKFYGESDPIKGVLIIDNDSTNPANVRLNNIVNAVNNMNEAIGRAEFPPIKASVWAPKIGDAQSLANLQSTNPEMEALSLIATTEELQQTIEGKGYAGHVNIGVTLVNTALEMQNNTNSKVLYDFLDSACPKQGGGAARFIIIGSTHGGTGAALNTAIAKKIRSYYQGNQSTIDVFGLFMMSYYSIPPKEDGNEDDVRDKIHIDTNQFRPADIEALEGYRGMNLINANDPVFDNILFCGYDPRPLTSLEHREGGNKQDNRFSIPELLMCAGANFIFKGDVPRNEYLGINLQNEFDGTIRWSNVPYGLDLMKCLGGMGLFACSLTEETKDASWNKWLMNKIGGIAGFGSIVFMSAKNSTDELPIFKETKKNITDFVGEYWRMLYQISTHYRGSWNAKVALLKSTAFDKRPNLNGFAWIDDNMVDATIINFDGNVYNEGDNTPNMFSINNIFKAELNNFSDANNNKLKMQVRTDSDVSVRKKAYFHALFEACYKTYGETKGEDEK